MSKETGKEPAVIVAERVRASEHVDEVVTLSTGVKAKLLPVSASLIDQVTAQVKDPLPPMWMNEQKGREEPNPNDPKYIQELGEAERLRGTKAMDALIMFGVDLVDGVPEDEEDNWVEKLIFLGVVEPEHVKDMSPMEREFTYKKHVALSAIDITEVTKKSGISAEELAQAEATFQRS